MEVYGRFSETYFENPFFVTQNTCSQAFGQIPICLQFVAHCLHRLPTSLDLSRQGLFADVGLPTPLLVFQPQLHFFGDLFDLMKKKTHTQTRIKEHYCFYPSKEPLFFECKRCPSVSREFAYAILRDPILS